MNQAYEAAYLLTVLHGNLLLQVDAYVLREPKAWMVDDLTLATTRDAAIGIMDALRKT